MKRLSVILRVMIYLGICELLVFLAQLVTGFFSFRGPVATNLTLCLLLVLTTRGFLQLEGLKWTDAGVVFDRAALLRMGAGVITGISMLVIVALATRMMIGFHWIPNPAFRWIALFPIFVTVFCSAFAQELAFRGYPFFLMVRKWGIWPAQLITAFFFGCMHLHEGMSWQDALMAMFSTGIGSLLFGMATLRTGSIWLATGIHSGWNFLQYLLPRALGQNGQGIWLIAGGHHSAMDLFTYMVPYVAMIGIVYWVIGFTLKDNHEH